MSDEEKNLKVAGFSLQVTRGVLRDRGSRRMVMAGAVAVALGMMVLGSTFLDSTLDPHTHPARFILYWLACAWVTITALLLALLDLLMVRKDARALRENLERQFDADQTAVPRDGGVKR